MMIKLILNFKQLKSYPKQILNKNIFQFPTGFTVLILTNVAWDTTMLISKPNVIFKKSYRLVLKLINFLKNIDILML